MPQRIELLRPSAAPSRCPLDALSEGAPTSSAVEGLTPALLRARYDAKLARMRALSAATLAPIPLDDFGGDDAE